MQIFKISLRADNHRHAYRQLRELGFHVTAGIKRASNGEFVCKIVVGSK